MAHDIVEWGPGRLPELVAVCDAALPGEELSAEELGRICWEERPVRRAFGPDDERVLDPVAVLGCADGLGAVAVSVQDMGWAKQGFVKLLVVHPDHRRQGRATALLAAAHRWLVDGHGAPVVRVGPSAPFYLWPGVDVAHLDALCFFERAGYLVEGSEVNMACPTSFRAQSPAGTTVRRAVDPDVVEAVRALVHRVWPWWDDELEVALQHGCCHAALDADGVALGFACHSVNRAGWIGPMGTDPDRQHGGVGAALLGQLCRDLQLAEYDTAEIAWVGPVGFYAKAAGATVSRSFRSLSWKPV